MKCPPVPLRWRIALMMVFTAVAIAPVAMLADRFLAREVVLIAPHDPATVQLNRSRYVAGAPIPEIYGRALGSNVRVLTTRGIVRPAEDSRVLLYPVTPQSAKPLDVHTLFVLSRRAIIGLLLIATVLLLTGRKSILNAPPIHPGREER